jgi:predicted PurR-regulated permease PerM
VVVACVAVAALLPLKQALVVRGRSSTAAAGIASLVGAAVVVGVAIAVLVALVPSLVEIGRALAAGVDAIRESLLSGGAPDLAVAAFDWIVAGIRQAIAVDLLAVAASVGTLVTVLILGGFLMFFLLQDGPRGWSWLMQPLEGARAAAITTAAATGLERVGPPGVPRWEHDTTARRTRHRPEGMKSRRLLRGTGVDGLARNPDNLGRD